MSIVLRLLNKVAVKISKRTSLVEKLMDSVALPDCKFTKTNCLQDLVSCIMKSRLFLRTKNWFINDKKTSCLIFHPAHVFLLTVNNSNFSVREPTN